MIPVNVHLNRRGLLPDLPISSLNQSSELYMTFKSLVWHPLEVYDGGVAGERVEAVGDSVVVATAVEIAGGWGETVPEWEVPSTKT